MLTLQFDVSAKQVGFVSFRSASRRTPRSFISPSFSVSLSLSAQMGPACVNLTIQHRIGRLVFLQTITPLEPLLQKVVHRIYAPRCARPLANFMMWGETVMVRIRPENPLSRFSSLNPLSRFSSTAT